MLTEKLANTLTEKQLRELIKKQGQTANRRLTSLYDKGLTNRSGAFITKTEPYLRESGRTNKKGQQVFKTSMPENVSKGELVKNLLNIQYYNSYIGTAARVKKKSNATAKRYKLKPEDAPEFWKLVKMGFQSVGFKVDSKNVQRIVAERMKKGEDEETIAEAIKNAAEKAKNGDSFISRFSDGGTWLLTNKTGKARKNK